MFDIFDFVSKHTGKDKTGLYDRVSVENKSEELLVYFMVWQRIEQLYGYVNPLYAKRLY